MVIPPKTFIITGFTSSNYCYQEYFLYFLNYSYQSSTFPSASKNVFRIVFVNGILHSSFFTMKVLCGSHESSMLA